MQFFTLLPAMLLAGGAYAGCYSGGETWGNADVAANTAISACVNNLSGYYAGNTNRHVCINANGKRMEFSVYRLGSSGRNLDANECVDGIRKEVTGCQYGGDSSYTN